MRTETTFNDPTDVQPTKALTTLPHLREVGSQINRRLLEAERLSQTLIVQPSLLERVQQPVLADRQRVPALRLGDPRVLALLQAVCHFAHLPHGFRHRDLRPLVASLLGRELPAYSAGAMTYDLRRLRLHGVITRLPHSFRYVVSPEGMHLAFGLSRIYLRLLQPNWTDLLLDTNQLPTPLRSALLHLDTALRQLHADERGPLPNAA